MRRSIHIVLVLACGLPLLSTALEETLEQRKQRITRKYMRERSNLIQSDIELPVENPEDDDLLESDRFKEKEIDLNRDQAGSPLPPPPPRPRARPSAADRNWLLSAEDPYAPEGEGLTETKQEDYWSLWGTESETALFRTGGYDTKRYDGSKQNKGLFGRGKDENKSSYSSRYGLRTEGEGSSREIKSFSADGKQSIFQQGESLPAGGTPSLFGRQKEESSGSGLGTLDFSRSRIYKQEQNRVQSPYLRQSERSNGQESGRQGGYTPYKSPYETRRIQLEKQRQQQWSGQSQQGQEYKRQDPYAEWKKRNSGQSDPTRDDAFINEVMPNSRR